MYTTDIHIRLPEPLKRKLKAKLAMEGKTITEWLITQIEVYASNNKEENYAEIKRKIYEELEE